MGVVVALARLITVEIVVVVAATTMTIVMGGGGVGRGSEAMRRSDGGRVGVHGGGGICGVTGVGNGVTDGGDCEIMEVVVALVGVIVLEDLVVAVMVVGGADGHAGMGDDGGECCGIHKYIFLLKTLTLLYFVSFFFIFLI